MRREDPARRAGGCCSATHALTEHHDLDNAMCIDRLEITLRCCVTGRPDDGEESCVTSSNN